MKKIEYMKPAMRVRQLYTEGSVMEDFVIGSPTTGGGNDEMDDDEAFSKEGDFDHPISGNIWGD